MIKKGLYKRGGGSEKQSITKSEYEVIQKLKVKYPITSLIEMMNVSRSGYYISLKQKEHTPNYILNQIDVES